MCGRSRFSARSRDTRRAEQWVARRGDKPRRRGCRRIVSLESGYVVPSLCLQPTGNSRIRGGLSGTVTEPRDEERKEKGDEKKRKKERKELKERTGREPRTRKADSKRVKRKVA